MGSQYYLIPLQYELFSVGTIFKTNGGSLFDLKSNGFIKRLVNIPKDWLHLLEEEAQFLISKKLTERIIMYNQDIFYKIRHLHVNDKCFYRQGSKEVSCTIMAVLYVDDEAGFRVLTEDQRQLDVSASEVEVTIDILPQAQEIEKIIELLLIHKGDIQKSDIKEQCVLSLLYALRNKNYFKTIISKSEDKIEMNNETIQSLLHSIINNKHWDILGLVLQKCNVQECDSEYLVNLSIWALQQGNNEFLGIIFKFLVKIEKLKNGETFLTNLFKENIDENTIKKVIEMKLFDLNLPNDKDETALILACDRLMVEVVKVLLQNGSDASYRNNAAFDVAIFAKSYHPFKEKEADQIKDMLVKITANILQVKKVSYVKNLTNGTKITDISQSKPKMSLMEEITKYTGIEDSRIDTDEKTVIRIMVQLMINRGDLTKMSTRKEYILYLAYNMHNKRFYNMLIQKFGQKIDIMGNVLGQYILSKMIDTGDMNILESSLDVSIIEEKYDEVLLTLGLRTLIRKSENYYQKIADRSTNKNIIMKNNETFLTSLFKENVDPKLILNVISSKYFDVNIANGSNETVLMLACERLMPDIVEVLLKHGSDISFGNYRAVDLLVTNGNKLNDSETRIKSKNQIMKLINGKNYGIDQNIAFVLDKIVDIEKILTAEEFPCHIRIGDPVVTSVNFSNNQIIPLHGEAKWIGIINGEKCVGIDLEINFKYGMDGIITELCRFDCLPKHGIVTTITDVKLEINVIHTPNFTQDGFINPNKYIRCKEYYNESIIKEKDVSMDNVVLVTSSAEGRLLKMKGVLRWCGSMNGEYIGVVELDHDFKSGTNGRFWRKQLIKCKDNRAIAASFHDISKYIPFQSKQIPKNERIFEDININSKVIYYKKQSGVIKFVYGTVRWTGVDIYDNYMYGIELKEEDEDGTDGQFNNIRLFYCQNKHGVVVSMKMVAPDMRFILPTTSDETIKVTKRSENVQYCIPNQYFRGNFFGIQGNEHTTFLNSIIYALFAKSHLLDFIISPLINNHKNDYQATKIKDFILWHIIYPLREFGFVSFSEIKQMKKIVGKSGMKLGNILKNEINLMSFATLLSKLCPNEPLLWFRSFNNNVNNSMFVQLSSTLDFSLNGLSIQTILEMSMARNEIMFEKIPACLIIYAEREGKSTYNDKSIIPLKTINISQLVYNNFKICSKCKEEAGFQCKKCVEYNHTVIKGLFCEEHKCRHKEISRFLPSYVCSNSEVSMNLKAIISIDNDHSVTYVKEDEMTNDWIYFNSFSSINNAGISVIPTVQTLEEELTEFLNKENMEMIEAAGKNNQPILKTFLKDLFIFIYENSSLSCY